MSVTTCECKDCKFIQNLSELKGYGGRCKNEKSIYYDKVVSSHGHCMDWEAKVEDIPQAETHTSKEETTQDKHIYEISEDVIDYINESIKGLQKSNLKLTEKISKLEESVEVLESRTNDILERELKTITDRVDNKLQSLKEFQSKWIIHRTLRKKNKEVYVSGEIKEGVNCRYCLTTYKKDEAKRYDENKAIEIRDKLNEHRQGKRYLWVISKV